MIYLNRMEGAKDFVFLINQHIEKSFIKNGIKNIKSFGISENVVSKEQQFPVFFQGSNGEWAGLDDTKDVIFYHKLSNVISSVDQSYGDGNSSLINRYAMAMIVFFDSEKTGFARDEMYSFLQAVMPEIMKGDKFSYIRTSIQNGILNTQQVFSSEYKGIPYSLKPEQSLISISYTLEGRFKKGCFNCCPEDNITISN